MAWTFSTGVLRGHEGGPLIIGNMMYVHTPFPNKVYAIDLSQENKIVWKYEPKQDPNVIPVMCCDTVNRGLAFGDGKIFLHQADTTLVALDVKTGQVAWTVKNGDPSKGETGTSAPMVIKDKVLVGISGGEFGVQPICPPTTSRPASWHGAAIRKGRTTSSGRCGEDHRARQADRQGLSLKTRQGDQWKIGGGATQGLDLLRSRTELVYYGSGNPRPESEAASRRQQMVDDDLGT